MCNVACTPRKLREELPRSSEGLEGRNVFRCRKTDLQAGGMFPRLENLFCEVWAEDKSSSYEKP